MILNVNFVTSLGDSAGSGYIAGTANGLVTVNGTPTKQQVHLFDAENLQHVSSCWSTSDGHYLLHAINTNKQYLIIARDTLKRSSLRPPAWDFIKPASDLTIEEQNQLWDSWQNGSA